MLNSGLAANVVKTALDKVFFSEFDYEVSPNRATARDPMVFKQETTDRGAVITEQYQGTGYFNTRSEQAGVPEGTARVGNQKTSSVVNYDKQINISKNLFDDDQHTVVKRMMSDEGRLARLSQDKNAMQAYALGFTTQLANDGVALFSNSHITLNSTTVDNLETGVFNGTNLETLFVSLKKQKTQDGTIGGHEPACLLVPTELHKDASEVLQSELRPGTANNDLNYYSKVYPGLALKESPFLSDTSTTAYFLLSRNHSVTRWVRNAIQTSLINWDISANNNYVYKVGYREVVDAISYEGLVASDGTV